MGPRVPSKPREGEIQRERERESQRKREKENRDGILTGSNDIDTSRSQFLNILSTYPKTL